MGPISITAVLSKVYERLAAFRFKQYFESKAIWSPTQYGFRKGLGNCDAMLHVAHITQEALDSGPEASLVQIDFSAAFDHVNHAAIIYKLKFVGVGGLVLLVIEELLYSTSWMLQPVC